MIKELFKRVSSAMWSVLGSVAFYTLLMFLQRIESYQSRSIIGAILGILFLILGLLCFGLSCLKCLLIMLAPELVTAHFDSYYSGINPRYSTIKYHYSYRGKQYTGLGRAGDFDEFTLPNTPFTLCISRINPSFSDRGGPDLRVAFISTLLVFVLTVASSIYVAFIYPNESRHKAPITQQHFERLKPIEWNVDRLHINATGMKGVPKGFKGFALSSLPQPQLTTLHIENHSRAHIHIDQITHDGTTIPNWIVPPGGRCDQELFAPIPWRFMSGTTVLGILVSTPQAGSVSIYDAK